MKKIFSILLCTMAIITLAGCGSKKINWEEIELGDKIPQPPVLTGEISTNDKDSMHVKIEKISKEQYKDYVQACIDAGYDKDLEDEDWDTSYEAFNEEGYSVRISYRSDKKMNIYLDAPETRDMKEIEWPTTGLGAMLPKPKSTLGKISYNTSTSFSVSLGNASIDEYNEYVKACEGLGYTVDFSKEDKYYSAKNSKGYKVSISYRGANVVEIYLSAPEGTSDTGSTSSTPSSSTGIRSDFKKAMDDYETFMDEYVAFMKKYQKNSSDLSLLSDYSKYMEKYTTMMDSFSKWESEDLNDAEVKYYLEVQTRVNKKLAEVAS